MNAYNETLSAYEAAYALCALASNDLEDACTEFESVSERIDHTESIITQYRDMPKDQALETIAARVEADEPRDPDHVYSDVLYLFHENYIYSGQIEHEDNDDDIWDYAVAEARSDYETSQDNAAETYLAAARLLRQRLAELTPFITALTDAVNEAADQMLCNLEQVRATEGLLKRQRELIFFMNGRMSQVYDHLQHDDNLEEGDFGDVWREEKQLRHAKLDLLIAAAERHRMRLAV